jgi:ankyrin repeat protein
MNACESLKNRDSSANVDGNLKSSPTVTVSLPSKPLKGALTAAVIRKETAQIGTLLSQGADINENMGPESELMTPLLFAIQAQDDEIADLLIRNGANCKYYFHGYSLADLAFAQKMSDKVTAPLKRWEMGQQ